MSGGFFRGTSADQDTRFSNKQAKLLKSQKFAPELEHLVDMSKVSMDVMRPWIANRATELLGFEDEVLINFIYGLLEGKVNGKEIQISLTGFMEKNTVKFMKELWTLLISAQNNASGVPQQFLDAKQEEARKKKEEADRFANEIQKKKEKERIDQQEMLKMEGGAGKKANNAALEPNTKHMSPRDSNDRYEDERGAEKRNGVKARNKVSRSPNSENSSLSPRYSIYQEFLMYTLIIQFRFLGFFYTDHEVFPSRQKHRDDPFLLKVIALHQDGLLQLFGGIHLRVQSPQEEDHLIPGKDLDQIPNKDHPLRIGVEYVLHIGVDPHLSGTADHPHLSGAADHPHQSGAADHPPLCGAADHPPLSGAADHPPLSDAADHPPLSGAADHPRLSGVPDHPHLCGVAGRPLLCDVADLAHLCVADHPHLHVEKNSDFIKTSVYRSLEKTSSVPHRSSSHGSLQRELKNGNDSRKRATDFLPSPERSRILSESPPGVRSSSEERRRSLSSPDESPVRRPREQMTRNVSSSPPRKLREQQLRRGSPDTSEDKPIVSPAKVRNKEEYSKNRLGNKDSRNKEQEMKSGKSSGRGVPESPDQQLAPTIYKDSLHGETQNPDDGRKSDEKNRSHSKNSKDSDRHRKPGSVHSSVEKVDHGNRSGTVDSGSEESEKRRGGDKGNRKNKRSERQEVTSEDDYSNDSEIDERKDAKRRRKEEKRSRKEKKRRRREERRRRKEERRAEKLKGKNYSGASASDCEHVGRRELHSSDNEETEAIQKKLEIELRKKALESLKAKKGISN
ncbi:unnamed protein product [Malus baccata var. baccata]